MLLNFLKNRKESFFRRNFCSYVDQIGGSYSTFYSGMVTDCSRTAEAPACWELLTSCLGQMPSSTHLKFTLCKVVCVLLTGQILMIHCVTCLKQCPSFLITFTLQMFVAYFFRGTGSKFYNIVNTCLPITKKYFLVVSCVSPI